MSWCEKDKQNLEKMKKQREKELRCVQRLVKGYGQLEYCVFVRG